jgi:hypothetical protein
VLKYLKKNPNKQLEAYQKMEYILREFPHLLVEFKEYLPKPAPRKPSYEEPPLIKKPKVFDYTITIIEDLTLPI